MVKSFSQDAASSMASAATIAMNTLSSGVSGSAISMDHNDSQLHAVASDSRLEDRIQYPTLVESNTLQNDMLERSELPSVSAESEATATYEKTALTLELTSTTSDETNISKTQEIRLDKEQNSNIVTIHTPLESGGCGVGTPCENSDSGSIISMSSSYNDISSIKGSKA